MIESSLYYFSCHFRNERISTKIFSLVYQKIKVQAVAAQESTTDKVPVFCECKDKRTWCLTPQRCACFKTEVKCGVACHGGDGNSKSDYVNIASPHLRLQKRIWVRDGDEEGEFSEKQRRGTAEREKKQGKECFRRDSTSLV